MRNDRPPPPPKCWILESFCYYGQICKITNVGGYKNPDEIKKQYPGCIAYRGLWNVYVNDRLSLVTSSKQEAQQRMQKFKTECLAQHQIQLPGNNAISKWVESNDKTINT